MFYRTSITGVCGRPVGLMVEPPKGPKATRSYFCALPAAQISDHVRAEGDGIMLLSRQRSGSRSGRSGRPRSPVIWGETMMNRSALAAGGAGRQLATVFLVMSVVGALLGGAASYLTTGGAEISQSGTAVVSAVPEVSPGVTAAAPMASPGGGVAPVVGVSPGATVAVTALPAARTQDPGAQPGGQPADAGTTVVDDGPSTNNTDAAGLAGSASPAPVSSAQQPAPGPVTTAPEPGSTAPAPGPMPSSAKPTPVPPQNSR